MFSRNRVTLWIIPLLLIWLVGCTEEVQVSDTVKRRGLLYKKGDDAPFTGIVMGKGREKYHTRRLAFEKEFKAGVQDGDTKYYHSNGKIESYVPYTNGKIHGLFLRYWPDGKPRAKIHFEDGMRGGARGEMFWDKKGRLIKG